MAVDAQYIPMMEVSRKHAIKALYTERAEGLCLKSFMRKAFYEMDMDDLHTIQVILYPCAQAVKDARLSIGRGYRGILERDDYVCQYGCGKRATTIDHVLPRAQGGTSVPTNLVAACIECNQKKGNRTPSQANMPLIQPPRSTRWKLMQKFHILVELATKE
jgi:hypothetical protein